MRKVFKSKLKLKVNSVIKTMVYADFVLYLSVGLLSPIFAVFIADKIEGGSVAVVGFATTLLWVVKSAVQIPVSVYIDKNKGELDDYHFMIAGSLLGAIVPMLYFLFASHVWHVYLFEAIHGVALAFFTPTWLAIFTRHVDKGHEGMDWAIHSNAVGLSFAFAAALGGLVAERYGFNVVFPIVSAGMFVSTLSLIFIRNGIDGGDGRPDIFHQLKAHRQKQFSS